MIRKGKTFAKGAIQYRGEALSESFREAEKKYFTKNIDK